MTAPDETDQPPGPYATAAGIYHTAGWAGVLPLPHAAKAPVPAGWTGAHGAWPSYPDLHAWVTGTEGAGNVALRLPGHVIGVDVDHYAGKHGGDTLAVLEAKYGPLPPTWRSTSRDDGTSGIRLYQVPEGLAWPGDLGHGIELIQYRHRYVVVWPSIHPEGRTYRWVDPDGRDVIGLVPGVEDLPALPEEWVAGVTGGQAATDTPRVDLDTTTAHKWLTDRDTGEDRMCRATTRALGRYATDLASGTRARHDTALAGTARLAHLAGEGHHGTGTALTTLHRAWTMHLGRGGAGRAPDPGEWARLLTGAVGIAAAAHPGPPPGTDPCEDPTRWLPDAAPTRPVSPAAPRVTAPPAATTPDDDPAADSEAAVEDLDAAEEARLDHDRRVQEHVVYQRAQREARRILDDEEAEKAFREPTWRPTLIEELAIPDEPISYLVDEVIPTGANVLLTAQFKAGKTTLVNHLTHCLADGDPFLGKFEVTGKNGRIALWNYEVDERMYRRWLRESGIKNGQDVTVLNLRGYRLPLVVQRVEEWVVAWLREHRITTWVVDPFARAFTGSGESENDNTQVGRFLDTLDVIKARAGVSELILPVHTGRGEVEVGQERARGATRLDDWADVRWILTKDDEQQRYFAATGRDVDVEEGRLGWDEATRRPYLDGAGRREEALLDIEVAILDACRQTPGLGLKALRIYVRGQLGRASNPAIDKAIRRLADRGAIDVTKGAPGGPTAHRVVDLPRLGGWT